MPTETKNSTEKASCSGSELAAARWLSCDSLRTTPAKKAPSAKETPKAAAEPIGDAERHREDRQREQFARAGARDAGQHPRHDLRAEQGRDERRSRRPWRGSAPAPSRSAVGRRAMACWRRRGRPALRRTPAAAPAPAPWPDPRRSASPRRRGHWACRPCCAPRAPCSSTTVLATERQRPNTMPAPRLQPQHAAQADAEQRRQRRSGRLRRVWRCRARPADRDAEKCRPTPNISRMTPISASCPASAGIGDEARRERTDEDAGDEIADQRRQPQPVGDVAEDERQHEADGDGRNKVYIMRQG